MLWDLGRYEWVAAELLPVAEVAVARLDPAPGEFVVDVGCGTGNATFLAASRGASVLGVDPSPRLLSVARSTAERLGLDVRLEAGEAAALPVYDAEVDAVVSVFAVIFANDPHASVAEMARVLRPGGRIVLTAWKPGGALADLVRLRRNLVDEVRGHTAPASAPFAWHDVGALRGLFGPYGFDVEVDDAELSFHGDSAASYLDAEFENNPRFVEARSILEPAGRWSEFYAAAVEAYNSANEDPPRFQLTSHYVVVRARRVASA